MSEMIHGERLLTELDHVRLARLLEGSTHPQLEALLDSAETVASREVPADVVTMRSRVSIVDLRSGQRDAQTLCYPRDADGRRFVSVLSPVGVGLIGLRRGAVARWKTPAGEEGSAQVEGILYQPEASGDYTV